MWSSLEVSLDVMAACLPVIAPGFLKMARQGSFSWSHLRTSLLRSNNNITENASFQEAKYNGGDISMERIVNTEQSNKVEDRPSSIDLQTLSRIGNENYEDIELGGRAGEA